MKERLPLADVHAVVTGGGSGIGRACLEALSLAGYLVVCADVSDAGGQAIAELETRAIRDALAATGGNKLQASRLLGISRATLYEKLALHPGLADAAPDKAPRH